MDLIIKRVFDWKFEKRYRVGNDVSIKEIMDTLLTLDWTGSFIVYPYNYANGEIKVVIYDDYIE